MRDSLNDLDMPITLPAELMIWLSSSFPVGAFAFSHGLEYCAHVGLVGDRVSLEHMLRELIDRGSLRNDCLLTAAAWRAAHAGDWSALVECNTIALALQPSKERHLETVTQGGAFRTAMEAAWPASDGPIRTLPIVGDVAYPVAVGACAALRAIPLMPTLLGYGVAFVSNLVSAAIRLSIVGQTDGQRVIAALLPRISRAVHSSAAADLSALGSATFAVDLASLAHETQYSRLFRS